MIHLFKYILLLSYIICCYAYNRDYIYRQYYTVHTTTHNEQAIQALCTLLGATYEGKVGELPGYILLSTTDNTLENDVINRWNQMRQVESSKEYEIIHCIDSIERQSPTAYLHRRVVPVAGDIIPVVENITAEHIINNKTKLDNDYAAVIDRLNIHDSGFIDQWYLLNREEGGHDLNVTGVWGQGISGKGITVAIVDDGLDLEHDDLKDNFMDSSSYDFVTHINDPSPKSSQDTHGTQSAGLIAAMKNDICGIGVAYDAQIAGIRIRPGTITAADEAAALNYKYQSNDIYSCSWDTYQKEDGLIAPSSIVLDALKNGIQHGRNGTGSIYVFATGNSDDACNLNGYTNSIYTITIGAMDRNNKHLPDSGICSAQFMVTYSSESNHTLYTTDTSDSKCTDIQGGPSGATSLASGVFALVLSANPNLSWRDLQYLCVQSAIPVDLDDDDWDNLPSGRMYNHKYGYGAIDAFRMVEMAKEFQSVREQTVLELSSEKEYSRIPDITTLTNDTHADKNIAYKSVINVNPQNIKQSRLSRLEHVTVTVNIEHAHRGDLEILLQSPHGIISQLAYINPSDNSSSGFKDWTFMTVKHWEEEPEGNWTLYVIDAIHLEYKGRFIDWKLNLWGEREDHVEASVSSENTETDHLLMYGFVSLLMCISIMGTVYIIKRYMHSTGINYTRTEENDSYEFDSLLSVSMEDSDDEENKAL